MLVNTDGSNLSCPEVAKNRCLSPIKHTISPSTILQREIRIKNLAPFFKGVSIRNITPKQCDAWVTSRVAKIAPQTFAHELEVMRAVFKYAMRHGLILSNPAEDIKRPKIVQARIEVPTRDQFQKLVAAIRV